MSSAMQAPRFDNRLVVITGAAGGLGAACARALGAAGASLVLMGRSMPELHALCDELAGSATEASVLRCDVTDAGAVREAFDAIDTPDVLISCAGVNRPQRFLDVPVETLDELWSVNVRGCFLAAQAAARRMVASRTRGAIVHLSSQMGHVGAPERTVYCATKHAVEGLTKAMALELAPHGIRVNAVAPTFAATTMTASSLRSGMQRGGVLARIPLGRLAQPDDVAAAVLFLASSAAAMITGTSLLVDGGWTAR